MPSIGDTLRERRVRSGETPAEAAHESGLSSWMVIGLEEGTLGLDDAKARAYLRIYARHLGLDAEDWLRELEPAMEPEQPPPADPWMAFAAGRQGPGGEPRGRRSMFALLGLMVAVAAVVATGVVLSDRGGADTVELTTPTDEPDVSDSDDEDDEDETDGAEATPTPTTEPSPTPTPTPTEDPEATPAPADPAATAEPTPTAEPADSARAPEETRVQVLYHEALGQEVAEEAAAALRSMGYQVTHISTSRVQFEQTTVFAVAGWEAEAEALRSRDARFGTVAPNENFATDEVDLHVGVGPDWQAGQ